MWSWNFIHWIFSKFAMTPQSCIGKQSMSLLFHLLHIWKQEGRGHWAVIYIDNQSFISTHITLFVGSKLIEFWLVLNCPHFPLIILIYKRCNFVSYHCGLYINLSSIVLPLRSLIQKSVFDWTRWQVWGYIAGAASKS